MKRNIVLFLALAALCLGTEAYGQSEVKWEDYEGVSIPIPPAVHPRLYLREEHIPDLKSRLKNEKLKPIWDELVAMSEQDDVDKNSAKTWREMVIQKGTTVRSELNAIKYLTTQNKKYGRQAITEMLQKLKDSDWPDAQDASRAIGRNMVSGAMVYDWCYDLMTDKEKQAYITEFVRMAKTLECGYPPVKQSSVTGHSSEWMIMRDLLSTSIAIYDEFPEMYQLTAKRFFGEHLPVRNWFYPAHTYHQGMAYDNVRFSADLYPLWILDRMGAGNVFNTAQQFIPYHWFYMRRPDGQLLASGDQNYSRGRMKTIPRIGFLAGSYYKDEYIFNEYLLRPNIDGRDKIFEFLWLDTEMKGKDHTDLPLSKYFGSPFGWMVARTGWGDNAVIAEMKINEYNFSNHQHQDAGAFQIYYKGPLAIDAGMYQGSSGDNKGYNSPHNKNYFKRTIAHNSLLIYDPDEVFESANYGGAHQTPFADNDGGQRLPGDKWGPPKDLDELLNTNFKTGEILAQGFGPDDQTPDYTYLKGDITEAYSEKVEQVRRSFVFLNLKNDSIPAAMLVYDKVVSADPSFKKFWLLHSIEEPIIKGADVEITRTKNGDSGKIINTTILPAQDNRSTEAIGGPGKEFWVFGTNYENEDTFRPDEANERGAWRVEVTPKSAQKEDLFFNVIQVMDNTQQTRLEVNALESDGLTGVSLGDRVVAFSTDTEVIDQPTTFTIRQEGEFNIMINDLLPGAWQILKDGEVFIPGISVNSESGTLYFKGDGGTYTLLR
ncbi:heparin/heparin-sulfate lyase HepB [Marinoscillum sp. MHG1-6]|uniref:heparin/heparin-sulfate lyase HepB n=1 Tax=Marinoscillum sp. MHG1-6 TaxID=2959627 RepID=UPI0021583692|nr:heparin/heparin-sulfate lyase HepB [Marinoscillum sp. MHG1-6]